MKKNVFDMLNPKVAKLAKARFKKPTRVQELAIPAVLNGENVLAIAPTGYGKTESISLPVFSRWVEEKTKSTSILYITPLRALNRDLLDRFLWWSERLDLEIAVRHGDTSQYERTKQSQFPPGMLITTPETLQAILPGRNLRKSLRNVKWVIVDEVHELVESKRGVQLAVGLERLRRLAGNFQIIGLSATVGSPDLVAKFLAGPAKMRVIQAISPKDSEIIVISPDVKEEDKSLSEQIFLQPEAVARLRAIRDLISSHKSTILFTNTREAAEILSSRLHQLDPDFDHGTHHSSLSKDVRLDAEKGFKEQKLKAIIATSSLELGIDIGSIDLIIQYQSPRQVTRLVQRVGRSGHRVGAKSKGIIIASNPDDILEAGVIARRFLLGMLEKTEFHVNSLDVLTNQLVGMSLDKYDYDIGLAREIIMSAWPYKNLSKEEFEQVINFAKNTGLFFLGKGIRRRRFSWRYYYENLSTIPDTRSWRVINLVENQEVGKLDESFVAEHGQVGETFIVKGRPWRINGLHDGNVFVEPAEVLESTVPAWEGELLPVPLEVALEVAELRAKIASMHLSGTKDKDVAAEIMRKYPFSPEACMKIIEYVKKQIKSKKPLADAKKIVIEAGKNFIVLHSMFGTKINEALSRFLAACLTEDIGEAVGIKSDPYRIMIHGIRASDVEKVVRILKKGELRPVLDASIMRTSLFKWRFLHVAKRFGVVTKKATWDNVPINKIIESYLDTPIITETKREIECEKLDLVGAEEILKRIKSGEIEILRIRGISPIGQAGIDYQFRELVGPAKPEKEIFSAFKHRLLDTKVRLLCMRCGRYSVTKRVREIEEEPACLACRSRLLTIIKPWQRELEKAIQASIYGKKPKDRSLSKALLRAKHVAELVLTYGKPVIIALAGRGVGPETAIRILAKQHTGDAFYKDILKAERDFIRTKRYWKV